MSTTRAKRLIDHWFVSGLSRRQWRTLRAALDDAPEARRYYDKVAAVRTALAGEEALDASRIDAVRERLFLQLDKKPPRQSHALIWAQFAATVIAITLLVVMPRMRRDDGFQARNAEHLVEARAFCIERGGRDVVRAVATAGSGTATVCSLGDTLQLAYNVPVEARSWARYAFMVGADARRQPLWYFPDPDEGASFAVALGDGEHLTPDGIELIVNHKAGALWVYALFSSEPLGNDTVAAWLSNAPLGAVPSAADLKTTKVAVQRIRLELE